MATSIVLRKQSRSLAVKEWLRQKNVLMSALAGERFSNREVLQVLHLMIALLSVLVFTQISLVTAVLSLAWFAAAGNSLIKNSKKHDTES